MAGDHPRLRRGTRVAIALLAVAATCAVVLTAARAADASSGPVRQAPSAVPEYQSSERQPLALFFGDSYTEGVGSTSGAHDFVTIVAENQGWTLENWGRGGTGFVTTAPSKACALAVCPDYPTTIAEARNRHPNIVVISGGRNDSTATFSTVSRAVVSTFAEARKEFPSARIYVTSPIWDYRTPPSFIARLGSVERSAAARFDMIYLDIGEPLQGRPQDVATDGIHPNNTGHALVAHAIIEQLASQHRRST